MRVNESAVEHRWVRVAPETAADAVPPPDAMTATRSGTGERADAFDGLVRLLDLSGVALLLFDRRGRRVRATAAVETLRAEDTDADAVIDAACALGLECLRRGREPGAGVPCADRRFAHTRHWAYRLVGGTLVPAVGGGWGPSGPTAVAVLIERGAKEALSDEELRRRFGLSPREVEVARLVAEGRSTPQTAATLGISAHTARHHLERVFTKVGVSTRGALQALVRGDVDVPVGRARPVAAPRGDRAEAASAPPGESSAP